MKTLCPICCAETSVRGISRYKNKNVLFNEKNLIQCLDCKLIFMHPMPTIAELKLYYETVWLKDESIISTSDTMDLIYRIQADERAMYLSRHILLSDCKKVLDVGSGYGYLYDSLKKFAANGLSFYATEHNPDNLRRLKDKGIRAFEHLECVDESEFDLATICFVLEHISEPYKFIKSIVSRVKSGGYVFIDVPERDDIFKNVLEPHVAVYTVDSLTRLAEKVGLKLVHITGYGVERSKLIAGKKVIQRMQVRVKNALKKITTMYRNEHSFKNKSDKLCELYDFYKFNEEGSDRWWVRIVLRK